MRKKVTKKKTIADKMVEGLEEFADALEADTEIAQQFNCHKVVLELQPTRYDPELVKSTRKTLRASQAVFAQFLGVSVQSVSSWEQGSKEPSHIACRFMDEIRNDPEYWRDRLRQHVKPKKTPRVASA